MLLADAERRSEWKKYGEEPECSTSSFLNLNQPAEDYRMTIASNGGVFGDRWTESPAGGGEPTSPVGSQPIWTTR